MSNNGDKGSRSSGKLSMVTFSELNIGDQSSFWDLSYRKNVTNLKRGCFSTEDSLSSKHSLNCKIVFDNLFIVVWVFKLDLGNWSTSAWIMKNLLYNSLDVSMSFLVIHVLEAGLSQSSVSMSLEDRVLSSLSLWSNSSTHWFINILFFRIKNIIIIY